MRGEWELIYDRYDCQTFSEGNGTQFNKQHEMQKQAHGEGDAMKEARQGGAKRKTGNQFLQFRRICRHGMTLQRKHVHKLQSSWRTRAGLAGE